MLLKKYDEPDDDELELAFQEIYWFIQKVGWPVKILVWLICKIMGDKLYALVAQKMHRSTMQTLHMVECGAYSDVFKRKREMRKAMKERSKNFVKSEFVDLES